MAAKRQLYTPVGPDQVVAERRVRRPLVQGRLVTGFSPQVGPEQSLQHNESLDLLFDDPSIQPFTSLPQLTESTWPRPEPLHLLDLSDTEVDSTDILCLQVPKQVLVLDASQSAGDIHGTEMRVEVTYENSPAKVICHTPAKLEQTLLRGLVDVGGGDGPDWLQQTHRPQLLHDSTPPPRSAVQVSKFQEETSNDARNKTREGAGRLDRGIIEEILAQELGLNNVETISLHSESSPLPKHSNSPASSEPHQRHPHSVRTPPSHLDYKLQSQGQAGVSHSSHSSKNRQRFQHVAESRLPQPKFDHDSDASVDQVPVKEVAQNLPSQTGNEYSDSETCSIHEYLPEQKLQTKNQLLEKVNKTTSKTDPEGTAHNNSQSVKAKRTRKVTSRYMQSATTKTTVQSNSLKHSNVESFQTKQTASLQTTNLRVSRDKKPFESKSVLRGRQAAPVKQTLTRFPAKPAAVTTHPQKTVVIPLAPDVSRNQSPHLAHKSTPVKQQKTSTPTHDQTCFLPQDIDASAIHSVSAMSVNMSLATGPAHFLVAKNISDASSQNLSTGKSLDTKPEVTCNPGDQNSTSVTQADLDLLYTRYLQCAFLSSKAASTFQHQERHAMAQISGLWQLVESHRANNCCLQMDICRLKRLNSVDDVLDGLEPELEAVAELLPLVEQDYNQLSSALDTTRHQLPVKNVYMPASSQKERQQYERKLTAALAETEQLLAEVAALTETQQQPLTQYVDKMAAIDRNVDSTFEELQEAQHEITSLKGLTTRLSSLCVQHMQT